MGFMQKQIERGTWVVIDTAEGTVVIPADLCGPNPGAEEVLQYTEVFNANQIYSVKTVEGVGARLSAPGYMDCTPWAFYDTEEEALADLEDMYGEDEDEDDANKDEDDDIEVM